MTSLTFDGVGARYPGGAGVHGLDLTVAPGEIVALIGLNGAGKTTLMRLAVGMLRPASGVVESWAARSTSSRAPSGPTSANSSRCRPPAPNSPRARTSASPPGCAEPHLRRRRRPSTSGTSAHSPAAAHPVLRPVLAQSAAFNLLGQVVFTLFLLYGVERLHLASSTLGVILSVSCLGGLTGAALAGRAERRMGTGRVMAWSMTIGSVSLAAIPGAAGSVAAVVAALIAGLVLHELGLAVFNVHSLSVRARLVPDEMLGRVTAAWRLVSSCMLALNGVLASVLGGLFGVRAAMAIAVGVLALCCLVFLLGPVATWTLEESPEGGKDGAS